MNERMKELVKTVTRFDQDMDGSMEPSDRGDWVQFDDLEKFAELIVRECIAQVRKDENGPAYEAAARIWEHFGGEHG
jgi:hypothetical protein